MQINTFSLHNWFIICFLVFLDDDIDEDELDRLAALVEEEESVSVSQVLPPESGSSSCEPRSEKNLPNAEKDQNEPIGDDKKGMLCIFNWHSKSLTAYF